jgi:hypothetical protein
MESLVLIRKNKIIYPNKLFRPNGSFFDYRLPNWAFTSYGMLIPLDFYSLELVSFIEGDLESFKTSHAVLKGILISKNKTIYEITLRVDDGEKKALVTPIVISPETTYGKALAQNVDMTLSILLLKDVNDNDIFKVLDEISLINLTIHLDKLFDMLEFLTVKGKHILDFATKK